MFLTNYLEEEFMAKEVKKAKRKVSAGKVVGETLKFVSCPPFAIGEWISNAADKKAAQKEEAGNNTTDDKNEARRQRIDRVIALLDEGKTMEEIAEILKIEESEVKTEEVEKEVPKDEPQT